MEKFTAKVTAGLTTANTGIPEIENFIGQEILVYREFDDLTSWEGELPNGFGTWSFEDDWLTDITPLPLGGHSNFDYE
jgi:hypothetical protein